jgi:glutathione synthase/RimK-type ligase-like ATP-grasp enzyme
VILIISTPRDEHAQAVQIELTKRGAAAQLLDLSEFPSSLGLSMRYTGAQRRFVFGCEDSGLDLAECGAVWWRRPQHPVISPRVTRPSHRQFALNESTEALQGLWYAVDAFWINDPARDQVAQRKAYQLRVAQDVGLSIPDTLITNCSRTAAEFVARRGAGQVIYKSFSALEHEWRETRLLRQEEVQLLPHVQYSPVIFQEYIEAAVDLRVTVVGERMFAAAIHSQETSYKVDFRMDIPNARIEAVELPREVEAGLTALMQRLGLVYGAIDMRRTPDGRHVFLEINPAGQWLFIEQFSGQSITATLAQLLDERDRAQLAGR